MPLCHLDKEDEPRPQGLKAKPHAVVGAHLLNVRSRRPRQDLSKNLEMPCRDVTRAGASDVDGSFNVLGKTVPREMAARRDSSVSSQQRALVPRQSFAEGQAVRPIPSPCRRFSIGSSMVALPSALSARSALSAVSPRCDFRSVDTSASLRCQSPAYMTPKSQTTRSAGLTGPSLPAAAALAAPAVPTAISLQSPPASHRHLLTHARSYTVRSATPISPVPWSSTAQHWQFRPSWVCSS